MQKNIWFDLKDLGHKGKKFGQRSRTELVREKMDTQ